MMLEYTPYVIPFMISTAILVYIGLYAFQLRTRVESAGPFSLLIFAITVWTLCYALELVSVSLEAKIFWAKMKYLGGSPGPVLWLVFSLYYTDHRHWLTRPVKLGMGIFVFLTLIVVFTNEFHHWFWTEIKIVPGFPETAAEHGFYFWVYIAGAYSLILASVVLYISFYQTVASYFRRQAVVMILGALIPMAIRFLEDFVGWDPFPQFDNVILFFLVSAILFAIALFRLGALEIVPIANDLIVQNINSGILVLDAAKRVVQINPFARRMIGHMGEKAIGKPLDKVLVDWPGIDDAIRNSEQHEQEISIQQEKGTVHLLVQNSTIHNEKNQLIGHVIVFVDITDHKNIEMELERLARMDVLTGVTNRRYFFELADIQFELAQRYNQPLGIILLDLDHFKEVNDRYGHLSGDLVLQIVAQECQRNLRSSDIFARYGGEEFICMLPEQDEAGSFEAAEKIRRIIEQAQTAFEPQAICVTASLGVAVLQHEPELKLEALIDRADQALYVSKTQGRNQVSLWQRK